MGRGPHRSGLRLRLLSLLPLPLLPMPLLPLLPLALLRELATLLRVAALLVLLLVTSLRAHTHIELGARRHDASPHGSRAVCECRFATRCAHVGGCGDAGGKLGWAMRRRSCASRGEPG